MSGRITTATFPARSFRLILLLIGLLTATVTFAQNPITALTVNMTTATVDSADFGTTGVHQVGIQWKFGTVAGSYTTCTVQAKTTFDGTNYYTLGSAVTVTVTTGTNNIWTLIAPLNTTVSATAANSFGYRTKLTIACSAYGTSAPATVSIQPMVSAGQSVTGVSQGSTTSGQPGNLVQGAVTTNNPTYTNGQTSPLSLTPDGELRAAGPAPTFLTTPPTASNGDQVDTQVDARGNLKVTICDDDAGQDCVDPDDNGAIGVRRVDASGIVQTVDPCQSASATHGFTAISTAASAEIVTGTASLKTYICSITMVADAAVDVAVVAGTGTVCATSIAAVYGGTTAATGLAFAANGGLSEGNGGYWVAVTETAQDNLCLLLSGAVQVSGKIRWAKAP